jgi:hypothetical protein
MSMKNSNDTIGNRSHNLLVCSAVPQPLCHRVPPSILSVHLTFVNSTLQTENWVHFHKAVNPGSTIYRSNINPLGWCWDLNFNYGWGWKVFSIYSTLYTIMTTWCTKVSNEGWKPDVANDSQRHFHFKNSCLHLRGIVLSLSPKNS